MAGLLNKFLDYIGIEETDAEDEYMDDLYEEDSRDADNVVSIGNRGRSKSAAANSNVVNLPSAAQQKMIVYHPISYEAVSYTHLASVQHAAVQRRRNAPGAQPRPPRDRPRRTGGARACPHAALRGGIPVCNPPRVRSHQLERLHFPSLHLREHHGAYGCRRADQKACCGRCDGPH